MSKTRRANDARSVEAATRQQLIRMQRRLASQIRAESTAQVLAGTFQERQEAGA